MLPLVVRARAGAHHFDEPLLIRQRVDPNVLAGLHALAEVGIGRLDLREEGLESVQHCERKLEAQLQRYGKWWPCPPQPRAPGSRPRRRHSLRAPRPRYRALTTAWPRGRRPCGRASEQHRVPHSARRLAHLQPQPHGRRGLFRFRPGSLARAPVVSALHGSRLCELRARLRACSGDPLSCFLFRCGSARAAFLFRAARRPLHRAWWRGQGVACIR